MGPRGWGAGCRYGEPVGALLRELTGLDDVLAATGADPLARGALRGRSFGGGVTDGAATVFLGMDAEERRPWLTALGSPAAVARLLGRAAHRFGLPTQVNLPRGTPELLGQVGLALAGAVDWDFRWTALAPALQPGEAQVAEVTDADAVAELLALASPAASTRPGDPAARRWLGTGVPLQAVAADTSAVPGVGHISSVATRPEARGQGLAAAVTAALTRRLLAEGCEVVTLGLFAGNAPARRLYSRLGFHDTHPRTSGRLLAA